MQFDLAVHATSVETMQQTLTNLGTHDSSFGIGMSKSLANGNLTNDCTNSYSWDADDWLIQVTYPGTGNNSQFIYDGYGHAVKIVETRGGTTIGTKQCGESMCEAQDASSNLLNQYFPLGQTISGSNYYYVLDHNGSINAMIE
jgi:hypothetical protein